MSLLVLLTVVGCCDQDKIPTLTRTLYSPVAKERNDAALELARCGSAADGAVPILAQLLYDDNVGVQSASAYALRQIATPRAKRVLQEAIDRKRSNR